MSAYSVANELSEKQNPYCELAKQTLPLRGEMVRSSTPSACTVISSLISSIVCRSLRYASSGGSFSSRINRSILLMTTVMASRSCMACLISRSVCNITPSTASTKRTAPSDNRNAAVASSQKLTCPGVSITLTTKDLSRVSCINNVIGVDLMDMARSCSVWSISVYRTLFSATSGPHCTACVSSTSMSTNVVFPCSRCPQSVTFRIKSGMSSISAKNSFEYRVSGRASSSLANFLSTTGAMIGSDNIWVSSSCTLTSTSSP
mmetsp:Transcript_13340/g.34077  ORF Transcript_13340/g.34077 Transcript_13340/m.34077 type:complete len:261 (-) Transcript_13340:250-1032(-)